LIVEHTNEVQYPLHTTPYGNGAPHEAHASGVSWPAIIAGAFATASLALILLSLGSGLGLSSISVWSNEGITASALGIGTILWLIFAEIASSAMGGYLAGRLRIKWPSTHTDEVYFRDTAHGFLAWSVALVVTAAFLGSAATSLVGSSLSSAQSKNGMAQSDGPNAYFVDSLFRGAPAKVEAGKHTEASVIFTNALKLGALPVNDKGYLDQMVSSDTGMSQTEADQRVTQTFAAAQQATETTRKAIAHTLLWAFISLLIGALALAWQLPLAVANATTS
jgi:hypothetical protein